MYLEYTGIWLTVGPVITRRVRDIRLQDKPAFSITAPVLILKDRANCRPAWNYYSHSSTGQNADQLKKTKYG